MLLLVNRYWLIISVSVCDGLCWCCGEFGVIVLVWLVIVFVVIVCVGCVVCYWRVGSGLWVGF